MDSSQVLISRWNYWANVIYIVGMLGYLSADTLNYLFISINLNVCLIIYIFLAILFVIDAILYTIDWYEYAVKSRRNENEPIKYEAEFTACMFQSLGSVFYLIGSLLSYNKSQFLAAILLLNLMGIISFLIESILTFIGWYISLRRKPTKNLKRGCVIEDVYIWAHTMNTGGGLVYLCAIIVAFHFYVNLNIVNTNVAFILQILGDLIYLLDAMLYYDCWQQDRQDYDATNEQRRLIELKLFKHFGTDDTTLLPKSDSY